MTYIVKILFIILIEFLLPVLSEACPELRLIVERKTGYEGMRELTSYNRLMVDRVTMKVVIAKYIFKGREQYIKYDIYELPGEDRQFYVIHFYKRRRENGFRTDYSLGQLTADLSGTIARSLDEPLQTVSMCDDNIFELERINRRDKKFHHSTVYRFRLLKHYSDGRTDVLCAGGRRFLQIKLTPYGCSRDIWRFT